MPGLAHRPTRQTAPPASGAASARRPGGSSQMDLRARLAEMLASAERGGDPVTELFGARLEAAGDQTGPQVEDNGHQPTFTKGVYDKHSDAIGNAAYDLSRYKWTLDRLKAHWAANKARYEAVAAQVDLPAELIAALHFRESTGDFDTYLHQGDPLGAPPVHHPTDIPTFHEWEPSAEHALNDPYKKRLQQDLGLTQDSDDLAGMAAYAEYYNGLGYHRAGRSSPYVYAGTDAYSGGKYVADGRFSASAWDLQPGVLAMVQVLRGEEVTDGLPVHEHALGDRVLEVGKKGRDVRVLQQALLDLGHDPNGVDGAFGPGTEAAVRAFQAAQGLEPDGRVGPETAARIQAAAAPGST